MAEQRRKFTKKRTLNLLERLDVEIHKAGYQRKFKLYCMGGTKMVLSDLRTSSEDIDFLISRDTFRVLSSYIAEFDREGIRFDVFAEGEMPSYSYKEFEKNAVKAPYQFKHLNLYFIDDIDFVITKILAGRDKDINDIRAILSYRKISREEIVRRFGKVRFKADAEVKLRNRFESFLLEFYR